MKRLLVKFGTQSLAGATGKLDQASFDEIARQLSSLMSGGWQVAIVTSGAIQAGREEIESLGQNCRGWHKKDFAAAGSCRLMQMWAEAFRQHRRCVGQILVTHANLRNRGEKRSIGEAIRNYMAVGAIPVLNENDVVSDREIRSMERQISENDRLTCLLCPIIEPDVVISATSVGGVFEEFPITQRSRVFRELDIRNLPAGVLDSHRKTETGSGGMSRKIIELAKCCKNGRRVGIISWHDDGIVRFVNREDIGTCLGSCNSFRE